MLNTVVVLIFIICFFLYPKTEQFKLIPQVVAILIVLNKDIILKKIGSNIKFVNVNKPLLNEEQSDVTIHCKLVPKANEKILIDNFVFNGNGYIYEIESPSGKIIKDPSSFKIKTIDPFEIVFRIKAFPDLKIKRLVSLGYEINSIPKSKTLLLSKARQ